MDLVAYLTTVIAVFGLAVAGMRVVVGLLGRRIDDLGTHLVAPFEARFDAVDAKFDAIGSRLDRLETQHETIIGAVTDLGQRVTRLEEHRG